jgi:hypothetical protein
MQMPGNVTNPTHHFFGAHAPVDHAQAARLLATRMHSAECIVAFDYIV